jgi:hypothetical protein
MEDMALPGAIGAEDIIPEVDEDAQFRMGYILFEETGSRVPYIIIPNNTAGRNPQKVVEYMTNHMKDRSGRPLPKPNIAFRVRARGSSYLEW